MLDRRSRRADRSIILLILIVVIIAGTGALCRPAAARGPDHRRPEEEAAAQHPVHLLRRGEGAVLRGFLLQSGHAQGVPLLRPGEPGQRHRDHQPGGGNRRPVPARRRPPAAAEGGGPPRRRRPRAWSTSASTRRDARGPDGRAWTSSFPTPWTSRCQGQRILLPSGSVALDGDKARDFISYQDPLETDADAIGRRQKFLQALLKGLGENEASFSSAGPSACCGPSLRTDLPGRALSSLVAEMGRFDSERMVLQRVLGTTRSVDGRDLLFPHQDGELLKQAVKQAMAANASQRVRSTGCPDDHGGGAQRHRARRDSPTARVTSSRATTWRSWRRTTRTTTST